MYANLQALMILGVVFYTSQDTPTQDGKTINFWSGGHHVYLNCVLLANLIILRMQHNFTGFNLIIIACQIASYFVFLWYFSITLETDVIYRFGEVFMSSYPAWIGCFFVVSSMWSIDRMLHAIRISVGQCIYGNPGVQAHELDLTEARQRATIRVSTQTKGSNASRFK